MGSTTSKALPGSNEKEKEPNTGYRVQNDIKPDSFVTESQFYGDLDESDEYQQLFYQGGEEGPDVGNRGTIEETTSDIGFGGGERMKVFWGVVKEFVRTVKDVFLWFLIATALSNFADNNSFMAINFVIEEEIDWENETPPALLSFLGVENWSKITFVAANSVFAQIGAIIPAIFPIPPGFVGMASDMIPNRYIMLFSFMARAVVMIAYFLVYKLLFQPFSSGYVLVFYAIALVEQGISTFYHNSAKTIVPELLGELEDEEPSVMERLVKLMANNWYEIVRVSGKSIAFAVSSATYHWFSSPVISWILSSGVLLVAMTEFVLIFPSIRAYLGFRGEKWIYPAKYNREQKKMARMVENDKNRKKEENIEEKDPIEKEEEESKFQKLWEIAKFYIPCCSQYFDWYLLTISIFPALLHGSLWIAGEVLLLSSCYEAFSDRDYSATTYTIAKIVNAVSLGVFPTVSTFLTILYLSKEVDKDNQETKKESKKTSNTFRVMMTIATALRTIGIIPLFFVMMCNTYDFCPIPPAWNRFLICVSQLFIGGCGGIFKTNKKTIIQDYVLKKYRGRVFSLDTSSFSFGVIISGLLMSLGGEIYRVITNGKVVSVHFFMVCFLICSFVVNIFFVCWMLCSWNRKETMEKKIP